MSNILVVDDDEAVCKIIAQVLSTKNYRVRSVSTGIEAIRELNNSRGTKEEIELIIMDIDLPSSVDGISLTARLKKHKHFTHIPVIIISGYSDEKRVKLSIKSGASSFIVKPIDFSILTEKIEKLLKKKSPQKAIDTAIELDWKIELKPLSAKDLRDENILEGTAKNISAKGISVITTDPLKPGTVVALVIHLPDNSGPCLAIGSSLKTEQLSETENLSVFRWIHWETAEGKKSMIENLKQRQ